MRLKMFALITAIVCLLTITAEARGRKLDMLDIIHRETFDQVRYWGHLFDVVRTKQQAGATLIEFKTPGGNGDVWRKYTTRYFTKGSERGLVSEVRFIGGAVQNNSFVVSAEGRIESIMTITSPNTEIDITPLRKPCPFGTEGCYRMEKEMALYTLAFLSRRASDGALLGGTITSAWYAEGHLLPFTSTQIIRIEQLNKTTERLKFIGYDKKWAYPYAGYDLETLPDGKKLLSVCSWFTPKVVDPETKKESEEICITN